MSTTRLPGGEVEGIRSADSSKPDPAEPWRHVCPTCGSQVHSNASAFKDYFYCQNCEIGLRRNELNDRKSDRDPPKIWEWRGHRFVVHEFSGKYCCPVDGCHSTVNVFPRGVRQHLSLVHDIEEAGDG